MQNSIQFFVEGIPATKGSTRAFITDHEWGRALHEHRKPRPITIQDNKRAKPWQKVIALYAAQHVDQVWDGLIEIAMDFAMPRPKKPSHPYPQGDVDKLSRCVLDALTGIVYRDDVQVVSAPPTKRYSQSVFGVLITVTKLMPESWGEWKPPS